MTRTGVLSDAVWARIEPLLPPVKGPMGRPMTDHRRLVEGAIYRYRTGIPWRDLPAEFGPRQTVWKRHHRFAFDGTWDRVLTAVLAEADASGEIDWCVSADSTIAWVHQHGATAARSRSAAPSHTGAPPDHKDPDRREDEPGDHAIGRSRGGVTTKMHCLVDGVGGPLVIAVTPGQAHDCPALLRMLAELWVPRVGPGRARTRPDKLLADKAYSARAIGAHLRARKVTAVIPEKTDQIAHRKRRGRNGGRPPRFDTVEYKNLNIIERTVNVFKVQVQADDVDQLLLEPRGRWTA